MIEQMKLMKDYLNGGDGKPKPTIWRYKYAAIKSSPSEEDKAIEPLEGGAREEFLSCEELVN